MQKEIKVNVLHCGRVRVDRSLPFREKSFNPIAHTGVFRSAEYQVWLPVSAYLIEHPKGLVLIDTGWHTEIRQHHRRHLGYLSSFFKGEMPEGEGVHEQLERRGYRPGDIDVVVLSHLHADHASGLALVKDAKRILVSDLEWRDTKSLSTRFNYAPAMWDGIALERFGFVHSAYGPERLSFDLFQDDTIVFVNTPGHTNGLTSALIQNNGKFLLLCSDAAYAAKSWVEMLQPGVAVNAAKSLASLQWVKEQSLKTDCLGVLANHDPGIQPHTVYV